MAMVDVVS